MKVLPNSVTRNFMPHFWMFLPQFLLQALTSRGQP
jgi:hypothetical protein